MIDLYFKDVKSSDWTLKVGLDIELSDVRYLYISILKSDNTGNYRLAITTPGHHWNLIN